MVCKWAGISVVGSLVACSVAVVALAPGCGSSDSPPPRADAAAAPATADARTADAPSVQPPMPSPTPPIFGEPPDAIQRADGPPAQTCGAIRNCVVACRTDTACAQRCVDGAAAAAKTQYQQVDTCSRQYCQANDINCRCDQECNLEGNCFDLTDGCRDFEMDLFCDELCR